MLVCHSAGASCSGAPRPITDWIRAFLSAGSRFALSPGLEDVLEVESCDLSDLDADPDTSTWPAGHSTKVSVDPVLGRIRFPDDQGAVFVSFHHGFSARLGGGEYNRLQTFATQQTAFSVYPGGHPTLQATAAAQGSHGTVEITSPGPFSETPAVKCPANAQLEIRGANHVRPTVLLGGEFVLVAIPARDHANGFLLAGGVLLSRR